MKYNKENKAGINEYYLIKDLNKYILKLYNKYKRDMYKTEKDLLNKYYKYRSYDINGKQIHNRSNLCKYNKIFEIWKDEEYIIKKLKDFFIPKYNKRYYESFYSNDNNNYYKIICLEDFFRKRQKFVFNFTLKINENKRII